VGNFFLKRMQIAATRDSKVTLAYFKAASLTVPVESLMRPSMILRVLVKSLLGPSKRSQQPYGWKAPADVEPVFEHVPEMPQATEMQQAA
jgi:hypothetical protein